MFASGTQSGIIRMGGAKSWTATDAQGYPPGLGIKFARTGIHSGSYVALNGLDSATWNFMALNFSNHIAAPASAATKFLANKFQQASQCPTMVGLSDMARYGQDGKKVADADVKVPFKLFLAPTAAVQVNTPSPPLYAAKMWRKNIFTGLRAPDTG